MPAGVKANVLPDGSVFDALLGISEETVKQFPAGFIAAQIAGQIGPAFSSLATLQADLSWPAGILAVVFGEGAYDGLYVKTGASGTGSWDYYGEAPLTAAQYAALTSQTAQAAAETAKAGAETARTQAELAALAAGAPLYDTVANGLAGTTDGDLFMVSTAPGMQVYRNDTGLGTLLGWVGEILFDDLTALKTSPTLFTEDTLLRTKKEGYCYKVAAALAEDHHWTNEGNTKLYVLRTPDGTVYTEAFNISPGVDESAKFAAALALAENGTLVVNYHVAPFIGGDLFSSDNTKIVFQRGTQYLVKDGGSRGLHIQGKNIHVWAYGAAIGGVGTANSHRVYFNANVNSIAENCSVRGLEAIGAGNTGDDCFYVGGDVANGYRPKDIKLIDCIGNGDGVARNCISIVAVDWLLVDNCDFFDPDIAPGLGIGIEANMFMPDGSSAIRGVLIRRTLVHDCPNNAGIGFIFGSDVTIEKCRIWGCVKGIIAGAGGAQFNSGIYRPGDRLGIGAFDTVDGWITVTTGTAGVDKLTDDLGIVVGMLAAKNTAAGASWPAEYSLTRYIITEIDATQAKFKLGVAPGVGVVTPSTTGTGTLSLDPEVSELDLIIYGRAGNNDKLTVKKCWISGNTANVNHAEVEIGTSRDIEFERNQVEADGYGVTFPYSTIVRVTGGGIRQKPGKTIGRGLTLSGGFDHIVRGPYIEGFAGDGLSSSGGNGSLFDGFEIANCGHAGGKVINITNHKRSKYRDITMRNDAAHQPSQGAVFGAGCDRCIAEGLIAEGVSGSNADSLVGGRDAVRFVECVQFDGEVWGEKAEAYTMPALAVDAVDEMTITVPGVLAEDFVHASFSGTQVTVTAIATNGTVHVLSHNKSGGALAETAGTMRVKVMAR